MRVGKGGSELRRVLTLQSSGTKCAKRQQLGPSCQAYVHAAKSGC